MAGVRAAVAFSMLTIGTARVALLRNDAMEAPADADCDADVSNTFLSSSEVLKANPGGLRSVMADVRFKDESGAVCVAETQEENKFTSFTVTAYFAREAECCTGEEKENFKSRVVDGVLSTWAQGIFGGMGFRALQGIEFYEVVPAACGVGSLCPLVVEISGNGGNPWAMTLVSCESCKSAMNVVMVAPKLGSSEETGADFVKESFLPWASAYVEGSTVIDRTRVFIASVSRGNEIALQAAIYGADIFSLAVMVGKFKFSAEFQEALKDPTTFEVAAKKGLRHVMFHIGDHDDILTDEDFYTNFTGMMSVAARSKSAPWMHLYLYRGAGHDLTFTTWNEMYPVIWTGRDQLPPYGAGRFA